MLPAEIGQKGHKLTVGMEHNVTHAVGHLYKTEFFGNGARAKELTSIVKQHALAATGIALIPVPGADIAALMANTWTMYVRINKAVGLSFGDNALKSIASGVLANLASAIPGLAIGTLAGSALKFIPGLGSVGGFAVGAGANVAILYVAGKVYLKALEVLLRTDHDLTSDGLAEALRDVTKDSTFMKSAYEEGKDTARNG